MINIYGLALLLALILNAAANLLMKVGMTHVQDAGGLLRDGPSAALIKVLTSPVLVIGLTCFALNACFYMFALQSRTLKINLAYPVMVGGGYAIIALVSYYLLGEHLNLAQKLGVALILGGVVIIATQTDPAAA